MDRSTTTDEDRADRIAELAQGLGVRIALAESLTAGRISAVLGRGQAASDWYCGAVVAYDAEVKFSVLGVTRGPVVTDRCAREMAVGVRRLLDADLALGITGVGGPGPDEGCPPGTVHLAVAGPDGVESQHVVLDGDPAEVVQAATSLALDEIVGALVSRSTAPRR
ncbi:damage-inducible protein CinA [Nocardioides flavus (ex Wang et al. 2016)]|uniref:Damage-inducible protein CinA n=1 Tax=Nocardioides flavus (ex Wang et al. 2016) TaxID=2058780 RepID=A0ABQ3HIG1_9ACTN|nr:CinA family protein [Nocardioides flavus (ex Wang et al. 2016)]GHE16683.1 damage-inducible protein CinA [Nocardioides flavus (ex Wang et al. 2016)]